MRIRSRCVSPTIELPPAIAELAEIGGSGWVVDVRGAEHGERFAGTTAVSRLSGGLDVATGSITSWKSMLRTIALSTGRCTRGS